MATTTRVPPTARKLAIVTHEYYPLLCGGTIFSERLAVEFAKIGYEVEIICCGVGPRFARYERCDGFGVRRFWTRRYSQKTASFLEHIFFLVLGLPQFLFYLWRGRFTHVLSIFVAPSGLIGLIIAKCLGIHSFVFIDGADTPGIESEQKRLMDHLVFLFKLVTRHSDGVIVLQGVEDLAVPLIANPNRVVIPNGTSLPKQLATPGSQRGRVRFLSIGRLVARKGFADIVQACHMLNQICGDFELEIIGYGQKEYELREMILNHGLEKQVFLRGSIPYEKLTDYYLKADAYIFYGGREGSSLAMIEALSYGLPIVCTDEPGSRAFVSQERNGLLVPWNDAGRLKDALLWILEHRGLLGELGRASRQIAETFTWAEIVRMYDNFFSATLNRD